MTNINLDKNAVKPLKLCFQKLNLLNLSRWKQII